MENALAEQVHRGEAARLEPLGQDAPVAALRVALEAEQTGRRLLRHRRERVEGEPAIGGVEHLLAVDSAHQRGVVRPGRLAPGLRRAEAAGMRVGEARLLQPRLQGALREAALVREFATARTSA